MKGTPAHVAERQPIRDSVDNEETINNNFQEYVNKDTILYSLCIIQFLKSNNTGGRKYCDRTDRIRSIEYTGCISNPVHVR